MWAPEGILGEASSRQLAMWPNKCGPTDRFGTVTGMNAGTGPCVVLSWEDVRVLRRTVLPGMSQPPLQAGQAAVKAARPFGPEADLGQHL